jgi:hypothetical protein
MASRRVLTLTAEQRAHLERVRDRDKRPYLREKAAALLKIADGQTPRQVALTGLLKVHHPDTLYRWLNEWQEEQTLKVRPACRGPFSPKRQQPTGNA